MLIVLLYIVLIVGTLFVRWLLCSTNYVDVSSISGTIYHCILFFLPILSFFIRVCSFLVALFVNFDHTIFDESLLKDHAFLFDVFVSLKAIHDHVVRKTWVSIVNEHFDKMAFQEDARDFGIRVFYHCRWSARLSPPFYLVQTRSTMDNSVSTQWAYCATKVFDS